jgi:hypothetical protein
MKVTNTLTYFETEFITTVKSFIVRAPSLYVLRWKLIHKHSKRMAMVTADKTPQGLQAEPVKRFTTVIHAFT